MGLMSVYRLGYDLERQVCLRKERDTMYSDEITVNIGKVAYEIFEQVFYPLLEAETHIYMMCLDSKHKVKGLFEVSHGSMKSTVLNLQGIFARAFLCGARGFIVAHNHPEGELEITMEDEEFFKELVEAGKLMGVPVLDYMVLGNMEYASFKEKGLLGE